MALSGFDHGLELELELDPEVALEFEARWCEERGGGRESWYLTRKKGWRRNVGCSRYVIEERDWDGALRSGV